MWMVWLLAGIAALVAVTWMVSRRRRAGPADDAGNTGASFAGDDASGRTAA